MDGSTLIIGSENTEKLDKNIDSSSENTSKDEKSANENDNIDTDPESSKDASNNPSTCNIEDEDSVLGEIESNKDFGGNIDEDELLKDTEGDESCKNVTQSREIINNQQPDNNIMDNVDSTDDSLAGKQSSGEEKKDATGDKLSLDQNTGDEIPDSSDINIDTNKEEKACNNPKLQETETNECERNATEVEGSIESSDSLNLRCSDRKLSETETAVTSSNNESVTKDNESFSRDISNEAQNENCNNDESESDSTNKLSKADGSNKENLQLNINEGSVDKTDISSENEKGSKKDDDSCEATKFLHIDQENSRPEESFESMETGAEDPFAQTSDVAIDTCENVEKGESDKSGPSNKDSVANSEPMEVDEVASEPAVNSEVHIEETPTVADTKTANKHSNESEQNVTTERNEDDAGAKSCLVDTDNNKKKGEGNVKLNNDSAVSNSLEQTIEETKINEKDGSAKQVEDKLKNVSVVTPLKSKTGRPVGSKHKRKSSSDDSSDSDFNLDEIKSVEPRPKRNAAKRAETQIKVLSQIDQHLKEQINEDIRNSGKPVTETASDNATDDTQSMEEIADEDCDIQTCFNCKKVSQCKVNVLTYGKTNYFCDNDCFVAFRDGPLLKPSEGGEIIPPSTVMSQLKSADIQPVERAQFIRKCSQCSSVVNGEEEKTLSWETMDFCSEECLGKYQQELGSHCANCKGNVQPASLGKYCVRFGYEVKQFCCSTCLEEFKKGLKVCSFCQKDISSGAEGFLAPVGDKGTFKDFCTPACMEKYEQMSSNQSPPPQMHMCDVCNNNKLVEVEVFLDQKVNKLCSDICFTAYKFANKLTVDRCDMCKKFFDKDAVGEKFNIFYEEVPHNFCCKTCMNVYILAKRKIVPCNWCKVKKYNFDMIKRIQNTGQVLMMCSLNCLTLYQVSVNAVSSKRIKCDMCNSVAQAQYHLTMSDATIRNFCTYPCVMNFQQQYSKSPITLPGSDGPPIPIPTGAPKRVVPKNDVPMISSVTSLANGQPTPVTTPSGKPTGKLNMVTLLCEPPVLRNKTTQTRPIMNTKSVSCRPHSNSVEVQTEEHFGKGVIPIPVPIYVPCPMAMYSIPFPVPVPFPLPIPVPVFLPTTRNSIKGIMKEIKRIREKVPEDPFEAELLMMAEMVAEDKKEDKTSSESEADDVEPSRPNSDVEDEGGEEAPTNAGESEVEGREFSAVAEGEAAESINTFGDDIMQMALTMATELDTPAASEDLETQLPPNTIQQTETPPQVNSTETVKPKSRGRKRSAPASKNQTKPNNTSEKKRRKSQPIVETSPQPSPAISEPKPDANMKLKYTFGVNAWKSWVTQKNAEIEKLNASASKKLKTFKTDMLLLNTDELNFSLCLFVKEVKKPNGTSYAPDTIYYLCLGIQLYLYENGRIDNIFTDPYFETFTDALDEVAKKFSELFNDHHYIVTRVEEEHLWESKQLGAHSPHVLLSTLMFFNTKHFNLVNVDEHLLLSFSHIMKHWKRNPNQQPSSSSGRAPGSRNVLLRFYPPQALVDDPNTKKKKVYEQHENEENPLRCPVKLYEFYLSKCPDSVKNRNDVFYLQPERSCVPDSPVWYSTMALQRDPLEKMLNRVKMVKEINIALLVP